MSEPNIQSRADFASNPRGDQERWTAEINAAKRDGESWRTLSSQIVDRFLDAKRDSRSEGDTRLNLFSANIQTQRAMLYGRTPRADVTRRFEDSNDDVARVAAEILKRLINADIIDGADGYSRSIALALDDYLLAGLGSVRLRYEADFEEQEEVPAQVADDGTELAPAYTPAPLKSREEVKVDYCHWRDQLWSPARVWSEVRWWAFKVHMTKDQLVKRFGKAKAKTVPFATVKRNDDATEATRNDPWARAAVWEIWSREDGKVYHFAEGCPQILDVKDDPLGLEGFFPFPTPLAANLTTDAFMPRPFFVFAQDLYNEIDYVSTRITLLERACKVVGVYDKTAEGVQRMLQEGCDNELIPVDAWAMFAERGGLKGQLDWMPLDQIVTALDKLREYRAELVKLLYEVTGLSDILRGQAQGQATATEQAIKAKFASVRLQALQDEFARFATDALRIKAEIVAKHYDDQTIIARSNIYESVEDPALIQSALQLIRDESLRFRVEVKPENISMQDFDLMKAERTQFIQALTTFITAAAPLMMQSPETGPYLLEMLKWGVGGFKGSSTIEGVLDQAIAKMKQSLAMPRPPPGQDPKTQGEMEKMRLEVGVAKEKAKVEIGKLHAKNQLDQQKLGIERQRGQMQMQQMVQQSRMDAMKAVMPKHEQVAEAAN